MFVVSLFWPRIREKQKYFDSGDRRAAPQETAERRRDEFEIQ